jgi:alkylhydroperoxidase family enzyme
MKMELSTKKPRLIAPVADTEPVMDLFAAYNPELGDVLFPYFADYVMSLRYFDRDTREIVRLRCARVNGCDMCNSQRWVDEDGNPISPEVSDAIDEYENADLPEHQKDALRIADAFLNNPAAAADEAFRTRVRDQFEDKQIVSLLLDCMKWSAQKIWVSLDLDEPTGRSMYFDEAGVPHLVS